MTDNVKKEIENRYKRLNSGLRRPSFEYLSADGIRDIFAPHLSSETLELFLAMSDDELHQFYSEWFNDNVKPNLIKMKLKMDTELVLPQLD